MLRESLRTRVSLMNLLCYRFLGKTCRPLRKSLLPTTPFSNDKIRHCAASPGDVVHIHTRFTQFAKYSCVIYESLFLSFFPVYLRVKKKKKKRRKKFTWYIRLFCNVRTIASKNRRGNFMRQNHCTNRDFAMCFSHIDRVYGHVHIFLGLIRPPPGFRERFAKPHCTREYLRIPSTVALLFLPHSLVLSPSLSASAYSLSFFAYSQSLRVNVSALDRLRHWRRETRTILKLGSKSTGLCAPPC